MSIYYPINEEVARRANEMMGTINYQYGDATAEYHRMVDEAVEIAENQKKKVDKIHHERIDRLLNTYARKLADNLNQRYEIGTRCPSIAVSGRANFPVRKKEQQNAAEQRNWEEFEKIQDILNTIRGTGMAGISSDDPQVIQKLEAKLAGLERAHETMKAVNAYYRKHKTLDGCPHMKAPEINRIKKEMARSGRIGDQPFSAWTLTNNRNNIKQVQQRIAELKKWQTQAPPAGWQFDGGEVVVNVGENRLQILFAEKPSDEVRSELRHHGFRWAPSQSAWQRKLTDNAIYTAKHMKLLEPIQEDPAQDLGMTM